MRINCQCGIVLYVGLQETPIRIPDGLGSYIGTFIDNSAPFAPPPPILLPFSTPFNSACCQITVEVRLKKTTIQYMFQLHLAPVFICVKKKKSLLTEISFAVTSMFIGLLAMLSPVRLLRQWSVAYSSRNTTDIIGFQSFHDRARIFISLITILTA